ncbi:MAG: helix-turn-helix domain-containing protein [Chitinophaga sp.]|uniref:helix-turn-helix transcriptional regulator n=1 Tax=Chitinophaga sp. TaxID=1869181 RepID=UPI0025C5D77A|nr:helix-turn-helix transcriptional regulator [Chitinophaga sp.]MBV8253576.1 helix-turn-helix domain-containing protein [Chitinophaga sp.]
MSSHILAAHIKPFIDYAALTLEERHQPMVAALQAEFGRLHADQDMVPVTYLYDVLSRIHAANNEAQMGIKVAGFMQLNALGLIYQISLQAATIEEGIFYLQHFVAATLPFIEMKVQSKGKQHRITLHVNNEEDAGNRFLLEALLAIVAKELQMMSAGPLQYVIHTPAWNDDYPEDFRLDKIYAITFSDIRLQAAIGKYSRLQLDYLVPQYLKLIEGLKQETGFINKVKIAALQMATPALPELKTVADGFNMTPRTFQRALAKEQVTFRQLTDDLNKDLALMLLRHNQYSVADVGYLLGYAEPAAFQHSFKKWYGSTPNTLRKQLA